MRGKRSDDNYIFTSVTVTTTDSEEGLAEGLDGVADGSSRTGAAVG